MIEGCTDPTAFNFNINIGANTDDGSCIPTLSGCTDPSADNYDPTANTDDDSCEFQGCTDANYLEYYTQGYVANTDNGSCLTIKVDGCMDDTSCDFNPLANFPLQQECLDFSSCVGCMDELACNYNENNTIEPDGVCSYSAEYYDCEGNCLNDSDSDGICDELELLGCTDSTACNYDLLATENDGCVYPEEYYNCDGECINDTDGDGTCDELEILGCTDEVASNYSQDATEDDGSCIFLGCTDPIAENYDGNANTDDDSCQYINGCTDNDANNYNSSATFDDGSCEYFILGCTNSSYYEFNTLAEVDDDSCLSKKGDFNLDGIVNNADLFIVLGNWLSQGELGIDGDVNRDGIVNNADLFDVLGNWLQ